MSNYEVVKNADLAVFIIDLNTGKSITNDAENVVESVNRDYPGKAIIYRDTEGKWDELLHENGVFKGFGHLDLNIDY